MNRYGPKASAKIKEVMKEYQRDRLKSSSGEIVKSRDQALAIGISEAREAGYKTPPEPKEKKR